VRWQPVSLTLMIHLQHHARERHAPLGGQLLRYCDGRPITYRRYDHLWERIGTHLPWVATQQISPHWLRHTTLTWVTHLWAIHLTAVKLASYVRFRLSNVEPSRGAERQGRFAGGRSTLVGRPLWAGGLGRLGLGLGFGSATRSW
jgi:hypothetical protein